MSIGHSANAFLMVQRWRTFSPPVGNYRGLFIGETGKYPGNMNSRVLNIAIVLTSG